MLILAILTGTLQGRAAASADYGQASDLFNVGAGARSMAMGSAFTALANDASAPYFNPAGLAFLDEHQLMVMHAPLFIDTNYNYVASANPLGDRWGTLALSDALLLSKGFQVRDRSNNLVSDNGSLNNNAIFGSYARKVTQRISVGGNAKFIQQKISGFSDSTLGLDAGLLFKPAPVISLGLMLGNINAPSIKLDREEDVYRPITRIGAASEIFRGRLTLTADITKVSQQSNQFAAGAELAVNRFFSIRTGYNANRSYTLGAGVGLKKLRVDYAFSNTDIGVFNKVSLTWAWANIYKTDIEPPMKEGRAVYPLAGFENQVTFKTSVPAQSVANWTLDITDAEGKPVRRLTGDLHPPAKIEWDAKNEIGEPTVDGIYNYHFSVNYKNGKKWENEGALKLALPDHARKEVLDMSLQLNGAKETELKAQTPAESPAAITTEEEAPAIQPVEIPAEVAQ